MFLQVENNWITCFMIWTFVVWGEGPVTPCFHHLLSLFLRESTASQASNHLFVINYPLCSYSATNFFIMKLASCLAIQN